MVVKPMIRNNVCMNAHPLGCELHVQEQIAYVRDHGSLPGPKNALIIGSSAGYGLATRIVSAFGSGSGTLGVAFESPAKGSRTATVGWYNDRAFTAVAETIGGAQRHRTILGDAFSHEIKKEAIDAIREMFGTVDLVIYSLASPLRIDPDTGERYSSVLKPIGRTYSSVTLDGKTGVLTEASVDPATDEEIANTIKVMGGEDWQLWTDQLAAAGVLADGAVTVAYSYIGPEITFALYRDGTIGRAKEHLEATAHTLTKALSSVNGRAYVSVNKALVTRASAVIPAVPLYMAILYRVMKARGTHEGTIEQIYRLFRDRLYTDGAPSVDEEGRIRIDDWEMDLAVQDEVARAWNSVTAENLLEVADVEGFQRDFLHLHGFGYDSIDYDRDVQV